MRWKTWMLAMAVTGLVPLGGCTCGPKESPEPESATPRAEATSATTAPATKEGPGEDPDPGERGPFCDQQPQGDAAVYGKERGGMLGRFIAHGGQAMALLCPVGDDGECDPGQVDPNTACSGTLVATDILMAPRDCLSAMDAPDPAALRQAARARKAVFGWIKDASGNVPARAELDIREIVELVEHAKTDDLELVFLRVAGDPGARWGQVRVDWPEDRRTSRLPRLRRNRLLLHHRSGKPLQVGEGAWRRAGDREQLRAPTDLGSRGGLVFDRMTRDLAGMVIAPGDCAAGEPARVATAEAIFAASRTLQRLTTVYLSGNRTTLAELSLTCGSRSCTREPGTCDGEPCCDENKDGTPDDPPLCWDTLTQGCSIDCPVGQPVDYRCSIGETESKREVEYARVGRDKVAEECGSTCSGQVIRDGGFAVRCHFVD